MMNQPYNQLVLQHFHQPQHVGAWPSSQTNVATGRAGVYGVGDVVQIQCCYTDDSVVKDACFKAYGNPFTIAAASFATTQLMGKTMDEASNLDHKFFINALAIPQVKWHCAILIEDAINAVVNACKQREVGESYV